MARRIGRLLLGGAAASIILAGGVTAWLVMTLPDVGYLVEENPGETALMEERGGERIQHWVPLSEISPHLVRAVLMGEDAGFYAHGGFDFHEIREALVRNWEEGRIVRGGSTITQQLAKNLFLSTDRTLWRKLEEAILTYRLESTLSKRRILEIYLNVIEWGDGVYGAEAGARELFAKSASRLNPAEAATLAAMIPNPTWLDPCERPELVGDRRDRILEWMHRAGDLTERELDRALDANLGFRCRGSSG